MKNFILNIKKKVNRILEDRRVENYLSQSKDIFELENRQKEINYNNVNFNNKW